MPKLVQIEQGNRLKKSLATHPLHQAPAALRHHLRHRRHHARQRL